MNIILLPTAYNPPIIYFAIIHAYKKILIETQETFPKQTWRNRCNILTSQGELTLSIPVKRNNNSKTIEIEIDSSQKWQLNHWRAIEAAYNKSPFFMYYSGKLQKLIFQNESNLVKYNQNIINFYLKVFKINTSIQFTETYIKSSQDILDLRENLHPKKKPILTLDEYPKYYQVFDTKFYPNLSILDLLNNEGPNGINYITTISDIFFEKIQENNSNGL